MPWIPIEQIKNACIDGVVFDLTLHTTDEIQEIHSTREELTRQLQPILIYLI